MNKFNFVIAGTVTKNGVSTSTLPSGDTVANLTLTVFKKQKGKDDLAMFYPITFFGKAADVIAQYAGPKTGLYVEGEVEPNKFTSKEGKEVETFKFVGREFQFTGAKGEQAAHQQPAQQQQQPQSQPNNGWGQQQQTAQQRPEQQQPQNNGWGAQNNGWQ